MLPARERRKRCNSSDGSIALDARIASLSAVAFCGQRAGMFVPPRRRSARAARPAGEATAPSAAVWRRYPKRDGKGRIEWIHWADLELAAALAQQALGELDAFVAKYSSASASAAQLEGGARAPITTEAFAVLRSLNNAFQALNVPPIVAPESEEFGTVDLIRSFVVLAGGRVQVRTQLMLSSGRRGPSPSDEMAALWRTLGARELASDEGLVVDVRTRRTLFRGAFEAALAFKRNASVAERAFLALWARRPWTLVRAEGETELVWSAPLVWERDRIVRKLELARPILAAIARDPWSALIASRASVRANNDALAIEWAGQMPELSSTSGARQIEQTQQIMHALAQARTDAALNQARAQAREGLATGAGSVAGVLGVLSAAAPPAALVLAPAAAVLSGLAALAGLLLQVIPRDWLAMAEVVPPRLPLPSMITGDEGAEDQPSHFVAPQRDTPRRLQRLPNAPMPLDMAPLTAVQTATASVATSERSTEVRKPTSVASTSRAALLARSNVSATQSPRARRPELDGESTADFAATSTNPPAHARRSAASGTAFAVASLGAGAVLMWLLATRR
jgi:hypothetical protein